MTWNELAAERPAPAGLPTSLRGLRDAVLAGDPGCVLDPELFTGPASAGPRDARVLAVVREAGIGWRLARLWPGGRARERQLKRQGGHARKCPLCGVTPRRLPRNRDGSVSRSRTTDPQKFAAGVMTAAQLAEHTALRRGTVTGKLPRPFERGPLAEDPWA